MFKRYLSHYDLGNKGVGFPEIVILKKSDTYCEDCGGVFRDSSNIWVPSLGVPADTIERHDLPPSAYRDN
jgi:hypothetical protein